MSLPERLFCAPVAGIVPVSIAEANALLARWGHYLGPANRPFGQEGWVLDIGGRAVSVAVSASIVSATVLDYRRNEVVELARLCSDPAERWATRPMLRLWREVAAPRFCSWAIQAAVAYSTTRRHEGDIYRWDGWRLARNDAGCSNHGGTWSGGYKSYPEAAKGTKRLWVWNYGRDSAVAETTDNGGYR